MSNQKDGDARKCWATLKMRKRERREGGVGEGGVGVGCSGGGPGERGWQGGV
jgi:hypothetical protein